MSGWHKRTEWGAFNAAVMSNPDDDTARLVAADWLDELDEPTAAARAKMIRAGVADPRAVVFPRQFTTYPEAGFPEYPAELVTRMGIVRGWPAVAWFEPHRFRRDVVAPVVARFPVEAVAIEGFRPRESHERTPRGTRTFFYVGSGPECVDGIPVEVEFTSRELRRGGNAHAARYRDNPSLVPYPAYSLMRVTQFDTLDGIIRAVLFALYRRAFEWGRPDRVPPIDWTPPAQLVTQIKSEIFLDTSRPPV